MTWAPPVTEPAAPVAAAVAADPLPPTTVDVAAPPSEETTATKRRTRPSLPSMPSLPSLSALRSGRTSSESGLSLPQLDPRAAAAATGAAVALTGIVLVWLSLLGCTVVRGVATCGGVGLLAILVTLVAQVALATVLLGALRVAQARSTAVLGVGLTSFVAMLLLYTGPRGLVLGVLLLVITPVAFVLAEAVTAGRFAEPDPEPPS